MDSLPLALLAPATAGFEADPSHYTWNLWPRVGLGQNNQISDFAPDGSKLGFQITAVPEPQTHALLLAGLGLIGATLKRGQLRA